MNRCIYVLSPVALIHILLACNVPVPNDDPIKSAIASYALEAGSRAETHPRIYSTTSSYSTAGLGSVAGADAICNTDINKPAGGVFRALIAGPGARVGSITANVGDGQLDWVLKPNKKYYRAADDRLIQETNSVGLFPFPIKESIADTPGNAWTGLTAGWITGGHCSSWSAIGGTADAADTRALTTDAVGGVPVVCTSSAKIICVERPEVPLKVFISSSTYLPGIDFTSVAGADALCMSDPANPGGGNYKAMMVDGTSRRASNSALVGDLQLDWVLRPFRSYVRATDGAPIQTTDSVALFTFPLQNDLGLASGVWTGLFPDWTTGSNCAAWSTSAANGVAANSGNVFSSAVGSWATLPCNNGERIVCVQQP
ncbi:MAG: DUF1554 domain-containing protein [Spirochaetia bacterium]|nr:DUF1554 domain-containing protein [Spirochaetia bacterium]